jgi:hypothetical protein
LQKSFVAYFQEKVPVAGAFWEERLQSYLIKLIKRIPHFCPQGIQLIFIKLLKAIFLILITGSYIINAM